MRVFDTFHHGWWRRFQDTVVDVVAGLIEFNGKATRLKQPDTSIIKLADTDWRFFVFLFLFLDRRSEGFCFTSFFGFSEDNLLLTRRSYVTGKGI